MEEARWEFLAQILVCPPGIPGVMCISVCSVKIRLTPPPHLFSVKFFEIDISLQPSNIGWDRFVPARALFHTVLRIAGIFCCSEGLLKSYLF